MARFTVTTRAIARLKTMLANDKKGREAVGIYWENPKIDSRRGPNGETQWIRESEGEWHVILLPRSELEGLKAEVIEGLEFAVIQLPKEPKIDGLTVDYVGGRFTVAQA